MLDVHAPQKAVHTWKDFLVHIAAISIGLLLALGLEATVEWLHHKRQAQEALELLRREVDHNRLVLADDERLGDAMERNHLAALEVLHRLRAGALKPDDRLIFVRKYTRFGSSAWKVIHQSGAASYLPYQVLTRYGEVYETQDMINAASIAIYADLQRATSVLITERPDEGRAEQDRVEHEQDAADAKNIFSTSATDLKAEQETVLRLSGNQDLSRLSTGQIDRLEQGFQQAISDDRRLHRMYVYLEDVYLTAPK